jgi:hypothetical protein
MPDVADVMDSMGKEELARLTAWAFDELIKLPPYTTKHIVRDGHELDVTIYHDLIAPTEHSIVVQVTKRGWLGLYHRVHVTGFVIKSSTEWRELTDEEKWPYT